MIKRIYLVCIIVLMLFVSGCGKENKTPKIGVSFGVGDAARWVSEKADMEARAAEMGAEIEVRLNKTDEPKTQLQDCKELIDSGIDVLIYTPRDVAKASEVLEYAKAKKVPVISYARVVLGEEVDLFVGYDSMRIGQTMGKYISELVDQGDYIILRGDVGDNNASLLYEGIMQGISPVEEDIRIIMDEPVPGWSADEAKKMVLQAVAGNDNKVDAIIAPNDKIAGACREALTELQVTAPVVITGMDAELDAAKRIVAGTQSMTIYMDLKVLANTAVDQAINMAKGEKVISNAEFDNKSDTLIHANLITGKLVVKENFDKELIDSGYFTKEEVYGNN